jgi:hypothetical protein
MGVSTLTDSSLRSLESFQRERNSSNGVYLLLLAGQTIYLGKAGNVASRLKQHFRKLLGRTGLNVSKVEFKCLLLDATMSTSANEELLIRHFSALGLCEWNGSGFGAKDPGRNRDTSDPSAFDKDFPIDPNIPVESACPLQTVGDALGHLRDSLPYLFRYEVPSAAKMLPIQSITGTYSALAMMERIVDSLGPDWQATFFRSHVILYQETRDYPHLIRVVKASR